jgi:hypothetical protein
LEDKENILMFYHKHFTKDGDRIQQSFEKITGNKTTPKGDFRKKEKVIFGVIIVCLVLTFIYGLFGVIQAIVNSQ